MGLQTNSGSTLLVTGGARSGKSAFAEHLAGKLGAESGRPTVYIATSQIHDDEMASRISGHRDRRPPEWKTVESPYDLEDTVKELYSQPVGAVLIDCVTMWLSNLLLMPGPMGEEQWMKPEASELILHRAVALARLLKTAPFPSVLVTNEVGHSLVPEYPLGRVYRDLAGRVNQALANYADDVFYVVCGIPVNLRQMAWRPD